MKRISVYTSDPYLYQKIKLALLGRAEVVRGDAEYDVALFDLESGLTPVENAITMSRLGNGEISLPLSFEDIENLVGSDEALLSISDSPKCAILRGRQIKLTDVEHALFSLLIEKRGGFTSREEILAGVWGEGVDAGVINVYVHYLREKLETEGEKIIISSRKHGYKIDEKYLGGEKCSD